MSAQSRKVQIGLKMAERSRALPTWAIRAFCELPMPWIESTTVVPPPDSEGPTVRSANQLFSRPEIQNCYFGREEDYPHKHCGKV